MNSLIGIYSDVKFDFICFSLLATYFELFKESIRVLFILEPAEILNDSLFGISAFFRAIGLNESDLGFN